MSSRNISVVIVMVACIIFATCPAFSADGDGKISQSQWRQKVDEQWNKDKGNSELIEIGQNGIIDYEKGYIEAIGSGAPNMRFKDNPAQARLMCLRAAQVLAYRAILETTAGVQVSSETEVKDMVTENDMVKVRAAGSLKGVQTIPNSEEYFSDLSCAIKVRMPINKAVQAFSDIIKKPDLVAKEIDKKPAVPMPKVEAAPAKERGSEVYTGLVIDARELNARPAMAPRIVDENGAEVYGSAVVERSYAVQQGMTGYARDLGAAQGNQRVTNNPVTIKGLSAEGAGKADIKISNADAQKLRSVTENLSFMKQCKVMIVLN